MAQVANIQNFRIYLSEAEEDTGEEIITSIGGDISGTLLPIGMNNLFDDVITENAKNGFTDYRCVYILNTSDYSSDENFYKTLVTSSPLVSIGTLYRDNVERFSFNFTTPLSPLSTNRLFKFKYGTNTYETNISFSDNIDTFIANVEAAIAPIPEFEDAIVTAGEIRIGADIASRFFQINIPFRSTLLESSCENVSMVDVSISKTENIKGSPINASAQNIYSSTNAPSDVNFSSSLNEIAKLGPTEYFYFWIRRVTNANSPAAINVAAQLVVRTDLTER